MRRDYSALNQHVAFADELARWVSRAGVTDSDAIGDLAVGFADILHAAATAATELEQLLGLDPTTPEGADAALTKLGYLHALFLGEMKPHLADLERRWDMLGDAVEAHASPDTEEDDEV